MKVCVLGLGYIGLPTACLIASKGYWVCGIDVDVCKVKAINRGELPIAEPDLAILAQAAAGGGRLVAALQPEEADVYVIAVPTPFRQNFEPDLSQVEAATDAIIPHLKPGNLILLESTCPVGTTEQLAAKIRRERQDLMLAFPQSSGSFVSEPQNTEREIYLAYCPERVLPGQIVKELIANDRVVGGFNFQSGQRAKAFYEQFITGKVRITDCRTAEMCKLAENAYRDINIAFANELSIICDRLQINVWELIELANRHPRVNILQPGPGVGGHCIAVDPWFLISAAGDVSPLLRTARLVNDAKPDYILTKIREKVALFDHPPVIACLGLSYKANVGDLRESPALRIVQGIAAAQLGEIRVVEPHLKNGVYLSNLENCMLTDLNAALQQADIVVLLTDHKEFAGIATEVLKGKILIDTRGFWR